jgi:hypothetical protein
MHRIDHLPEGGRRERAWTSGLRRVRVLPKQGRGIIRGTTERPLEGRVILIVDWEPLASQSNRTALEAAGADVAVLATKAEAKEFVLHFPVHAALIHFPFSRAEAIELNNLIKVRGIPALFYGVPPYGYSKARFRSLAMLPASEELIGILESWRLDQPPQQSTLPHQAGKKDLKSV